MAYDSPRSSTRGAPVRNGRGSSRGGGGGQNLAALAIAAVLVVGIIVVVVVTSGGDKPAPKPAVAETPKTPPPAAGPTKPAEKPYPVVPQTLADRGRKIVADSKAKADEADRLYTESQKAKKAGNDAEWQSKLKQARQIYDGINDEWNDFEASLPTGNGYDQEQVAAHYFARERGQIQKYVKNLSAVKTDER